jgi:biopolymer transport protein TolR
MAMQAGGSEGGLSSDINVTPMIDVLLVLLIIFMIILPLSRRAFTTQVPPEQQQQQSKQQSSQIVLELTAAGGYAINTQPYAKGQLDAALHEIYDQRVVKLLFIKTAPNREYGDVIDAMDIAKGAGVQVIGLTPPEEPGQSK